MIRVQAHHILVMIPEQVTKRFNGQYEEDSRQRIALFTSPSWEQSGMNVLNDEKMCLRVGVKKPDPLVERRSEAHFIQHLQQIAPVDPVEGLLKSKNSAYASSSRPVTRS